MTAPAPENATAARAAAAAQITSQLAVLDKGVSSVGERIDALTDASLARFDGLVELVNTLHAQVAELAAKAATPAASARPQGPRPSYSGGVGKYPEAGTPEDLDGPKGDPQVRFSPRDWSGTPHEKGTAFSKCEPAFLRMYAETKDYFASKDENNGDEKGARYGRMDAARARAWADRLAQGSNYQPRPVTGKGRPIADYDTAPIADDGEFDSDGIPF